jgi:hypothetical protein
MTDAPLHKAEAGRLLSIINIEVIVALLVALYLFYVSTVFKQTECIYRVIARSISSRDILILERYSWVFIKMTLHKTVRKDTLADE